jgi:hypothetical protein
MRRRLRAIDGPLAGASWVLGKRTRLGRAADSDVQIVHDGVSRQHAHIVEVESGEHEIVDLHSNNGTWISNRKVERCRLRVGDEVRLVEARFVYEDAPEEKASDERSAAYVVKVTTGRTLRRTMSIEELEVPRPRKEKDTVEDLTPPSPVPIPPGHRPQSERHLVVAQRSDGSDYGGNIISDVIEYRHLRMRQAREESLDDTAHERYVALDRELGHPGETSDEELARRRFCRFRVGFPARLRHGGQNGDHTSDVTVVDLSAGGARISGPEHGLRVGDLAWLVIDLETAGDLRTFVFASRVVRVYDDGDLGIIFAGAPEWDAWSDAHGS